MIYNLHHLRQLVLSAQAQTIYIVSSASSHRLNTLRVPGHQWSYHVSVIYIYIYNYIYIQLCVYVCVCMCVYIRLYYTSVIPSGYGMVQCDNQWFGIPPINGHPAFQRESVTPLQQPSLMLGCLVTSHSRKSASAGKRIPCSPSSRHWAVFDWPFQFHILTPSKERPIDLYIYSLFRSASTDFDLWLSHPAKKWESLGMTVPFSRNQESLRTCFTHPRQLWNLGHYRRCPLSGPANEQKIPSGNLTWLLKIAIYSESSHYCHWWIFP